MKKRETDVGDLEREIQKNFSVQFKWETFIKTGHCILRKLTSCKIASWSSSEYSFYKNVGLTMCLKSFLRGLSLTASRIIIIFFQIELTISYPGLQRDRKIKLFLNRK